MRLPKNIFVLFNIISESGMVTFRSCNNTALQIQVGAPPVSSPVTMGTVSLPPGSVTMIMTVGTTVMKIIALLSLAVSLT